MSKHAGTKDAAAPQAATNSTPQKELYPMVNWKYDMFLYTVGNIVDMFFREVVPRGAWRVPQTGPVLFVAAPHANQVSCALYLGPMIAVDLRTDDTKQCF
jgi:glycerol-3-phosphate O-acyltransferase/dihydroxyacetone phosphate acyltransferase